MRRFTVELMRRLAEARIGSVLPDLPGMGESLVDLADVGFGDWVDAARGIADAIREKEGRCLSVAIRGGAILDGVADAGWRLAPESGERVLRDLVRSAAIGGDKSASAIDRAARERPISLAGQTVSPVLYTALLLAPMTGAARRTARLVDDAGPRDVSLEGARLWRAAEPSEDARLAEASAEDILAWTETCDA